MTPASATDSQLDTTTVPADPPTAAPPAAARVDGPGSVSTTTGRTAPAVSPPPLLDVEHRTDLGGLSPEAAHRTGSEGAALLDARTRMGAVELIVADRRAMEDFYVRGVGLTPLATSRRRTVLGLGERVVLTLVDGEGRRPARRGSAGLFHTAIVFDSPRELARSLVRMWVRHAELFEGPGDHLVSQAFYFHDPEGNGLELYYDRPRSSWQWEGGMVRMDTLAIDPTEFLAAHLGISGTQREIAAARELRGVPASREVDADDALDVAGQVGHVHLQVGDVASARAFYVDALGFDVTSEMPGSALFVSAGGYHHHMAMNVWNSRGAGLRAPALGLGKVDISLPDAHELASTRERLRAHGLAVLDDVDGGASATSVEGRGRLVVPDPWGNEIRLTVA